LSFLDPIVKLSVILEQTTLEEFTGYYSHWLSV